MDGRTDGRTRGSSDKLREGWINGCMDGPIDELMD